MSVLYLKGDAARGVGLVLSVVTLLSRRTATVADLVFDTTLGVFRRGVTVLFTFAFSFAGMAFEEDEEDMFCTRALNGEGGREVDCTSF